MSEPRDASVRAEKDLPRPETPEDTLEATATPEAAAPASQIGETELRTFLIADIRGYTTYTREHGDAAACGARDAVRRARLGGRRGT